MKISPPEKGLHKSQPNTILLISIFNDVQGQALRNSADRLCYFTTHTMMDCSAVVCGEKHHMYKNGKIKLQNLCVCLLSTDYINRCFPNNMNLLSD